MKKVFIAYSFDTKKKRFFLQFEKKFEAVYSLNKKNLSDLPIFPEVKNNPLSQILFFFSIDFYLENKDIIIELYDKKGNYDYSFFIVIGAKDHKKISKINLNTPFTLVPDQQFHDFFQKILSQPTVNLRDTIRINNNGLNNKILEVITILGSERNIEVLMNKILTICMEIGLADAGSLAILGFDKQLRETDKDILTFYVSKNNSKEIHFNRFSMKIDLNSLAGYSIIKKRILNISDAYKISPKKKYQFNNTFDKKTGFRTKSVLVIPLLDSHNNVLGVIQLLNKKKGGYQKIIDYNNFLPSEISDFSLTQQQTIMNIANIASILLKNQLLYNQVNSLLEDFVKASVYAVEQRDPTTSGHSERVATYCVELAKVTTASKGILENYHFDSQQIQEIRYAALLHDFGKIAVREKTLVKAKKLESYELENIFKKIRIYLLNFQLAAEQRKIDLHNNGKLNSDVIANKIEQIDKQIKKEIQKMDRFQRIILESNNPQIIEKGISTTLKKIQKIKFFDNGQEQYILTNDEFKFLNIKRGSLSQEERLEIESHVTQSFYFLQKINWITGFKNIPEIAYGHHEKLDGHGYPRKLKSYQILPQTKIMTVCDIYDALTASDRPYKKSLTPQQSIKILYDEVDQNKIDGNLVDIFVKKKVFRVKPSYLPI